jgi:hypothetical protein
MSRPAEGAMAKSAIVSRPQPAAILRGDDPPYPPMSALAKSAIVSRPQPAAILRGDDPPYPPYPPMSALARTTDCRLKGDERWR